jgi:hypothetical protein
MVFEGLDEQTPLLQTSTVQSTPSLQSEFEQQLRQPTFWQQRWPLGQPT